MKRFGADTVTMCGVWARRGRSTCVNRTTIVVEQKKWKRTLRFAYVGLPVVEPSGWLSSKGD